MMCDSSARLTFALTSSSDREKTLEWDRREETRLWKDVALSSLGHDETYRTIKKIIIAIKVWTLAQVWPESSSQISRDSF